MFISKIQKRQSGILLYGITPPKSHTPSEKIREIAAKTVNNIVPLDIDGLVVYDVQDESARTSEERPFPFFSALDPFAYAKDHLDSVQATKIIYRPAGKFSKEELTTWMQQVKDACFCPVFVGVPAPDYIPKTTLGEAYAICREVYGEESVIGAVTIPERHHVLRDEEKRILDKTASGVSYFISQCIFNVEYTKQMLNDVLAACTEKGSHVPTMIFTLTICGSAKTLNFMEWLGIHVPDEIKNDLLTCEKPVSRSVEIAVNIAQELTLFCQQRSIPFGFNIESVAIRKEEIDASLELTNKVSAILQSAGLRTGVQDAEKLVA